MTIPTKSYATAEAFRATIEENARIHSRKKGESLQLVRRRYAFEAFLRRIPRSGQPLVLKGGYLLHMRFAAGSRTTKDLDTAMNDPVLQALPPTEVADRLQAALQAVAAVPDRDFFEFRISTSKHDLGADREFVGFRFSVIARLDSREFDTFIVDCTAGDAIVRPLDKLSVGHMFTFAGLDIITIDAITVSQHVAEKLHAICRARRGHESNRVKDLFDVVLFIKQGATAAAVANVIGEIFEQAGNTPLDRLANAAPGTWRTRYDSMAVEHGLNILFDEAIRLHAEFCTEILRQLEARRVELISGSETS